jgi:alpha/beta superfamily hydrolase
MNNSPMLPKNAQQILIPGPVGTLDCLELQPVTANILGIAIVFHPDPKGGGTYTNKVVQTIAKVLCQHGYLVICPNLRGVGNSEGIHDMGNGEIEDGIYIHNYLRNKYDSNLPLVLAGFSFGTSVASNIATKTVYERLILVGPAVSKYSVAIENVSKTIVIHGECDDVIPANAVWEWSRQHDLPVTWFPNTGHFFHGKLGLLQSVIASHFGGGIKYTHAV